MFSLQIHRYPEDKGLRLQVQRAELMPDVWPFAAWCYRRNAWTQQDFCLFASFPWHSNVAVTKLVSSGGVVTKIS